MGATMCYSIAYHTAHHCPRIVDAETLGSRFSIWRAERLEWRDDVMKQRSASILRGSEWARPRALYKAMGYTHDDQHTPIVAIANTWTTLSPNHYNPNAIAQSVSEGTQSADGTQVQFG